MLAEKRWINSGRAVCGRVEGEERLLDPSHLLAEEAAPAPLIEGVWSRGSSAPPVRSCIHGYWRLWKRELVSVSAGRGEVMSLLILQWLMPE